jgi:hypothetical protein
MLVMVVAAILAAVMLAATVDCARGYAGARSGEDHPRAAKEGGVL